MTRNCVHQAVLEDMHALKRFVLTENSETGYDATDGFDRAFTLPSSILFTITIMTTVGWDHFFNKEPNHRNQSPLVYRSGTATSPPRQRKENCFVFSTP